MHLNSRSRQLPVVVMSPLPIRPAESLSSHRRGPTEETTDETLDSQWAAQVTRYTVSKIHRRLPPVPASKDGSMTIAEKNIAVRRASRGGGMERQALP